MNYRKGLSFVALMIIVALFGLLCRVALREIMSLNIAQNESTASATLKLISAALENYAKENKGIYPESLIVLTESDPAYLDRDYINESPLKGYAYSCLRLEATGYSCLAAPLKCAISGKNIYTVTTGGSLTSEECSRKD